MPPALLTTLDGCKSSDIASKPTQQEHDLNNMSHSDDLLQYLNEGENGERVGSTTDPLHGTMPDSSSDHHDHTLKTLSKLLNGDSDHSELLPDSQAKLAGFDTSITLNNFLNSELDGSNVNDYSKIEASQTLQDSPMNSANSQPGVFRGTRDALMTSVASSLPSDLHNLKMDTLMSPSHNAFPSSLSQGDSSNSSLFASVSNPMDGQKDVPMAMAFPGSERSQGTSMMDMSHCELEGGEQSYEGTAQSYEGTAQMQMVDFEGTPSVVTMCSSSGGVVPSLPLSGTSTQSPMGHSVPTTSLAAPLCTVNPVSSEHSPNGVSSSTPEPKASMLRHLLQGDFELSSDSASPQSSHDEALNSPSSVSSPGSLYHDGSTQATLIQQSAQLEINSDASLIIEDATPSDLWHSVLETTMMESPSKVHKAHHGADAHSSNDVSNPAVFDAGAASSQATFMFEKFGTEHGVFPFTALAHSSSNTGAKTISTSATDTRVVPVLLSEMNNTGRPVRSGMGRRLKEPSLNAHYPARAGPFELAIKAQPEDQHRARYLTEGSRGAVKDRSGQGFPIVKLNGYNEPVTLQVFVGNETGRVKPHGFYQACRVCGKNSTSCSERETEGTVIIEMELSPLNDMTVSIDCVGILKLRNADVEKRIGVAKAKAKKKNNTRARLVFRTSFQKTDGAWQTLQVASQPILCTQPIGQPEIGRVSLKKCDVNGGESLFILGKNFMKGTEIIFQEVALESGKVTWHAEAELDTDYFQSSHLICTVPPYCNKHITSPAQVQIVAKCSGKFSEPQEFTYQPLANPPSIKQEVPMETDAPVSKALPFGVSPVALELNRAVEEMQQGTPGSSGLFQLPAGMVSGIDSAPTLPSPSLTSTSLTLPQSSPAPALQSQPSISPAPSLQMLGAGGSGQLPQVLLVNPGSGATPASAQVIPLGGTSNSGQGPMIIVLPNNGQGVQELQQQQQQPPQQQQQQQPQQQAQALLQLQLQLQLQALLQQKQQRPQPQPAVSSQTSAALLHQLLLSELQGGAQMASSPHQFQPPASVPQTPQSPAQSQQLPQSPLAGQIPLSPLSQIPASLSMALQSSPQGQSLPGSPSLQGGNMPPSPMQSSQTAASPHSVHSPSDNSSTLNLQNGNPLNLGEKAFLHLLASQSQRKSTPNS